MAGVQRRRPRHRYTTGTRLLLPHSFILLCRKKASKRRVDTFTTGLPLTLSEWEEGGTSDKHGCHVTTQRRVITACGISEELVTQTSYRNTKTFPLLLLERW